MRNKIFLTLFLTLLTTSCSFFYGDHGMIKNHDRDYLAAKSIPPLRIPPGYSSDTITAHYPVSDRNFPENTKTPDLTPPELKAYPKN